MSHCFRDTRFEGHYVKLMRRVEEDRGVIMVLENRRKRVVGCAVIERLPTFQQQHVGQLSFRVAPEYNDQTTELLDAAGARAHGIGISLLQTYVSDKDSDAGRMLEEAGFEREAVLPGRLRTAGGLTGVAVYDRRLGDTGPSRPLEDYYGERKPWQEVRSRAMDKDGMS